MEIHPSQADNSLSAADDGAVFDGLPDDLSFQILARIPFASLSSAKAVCKAWLNALSSGTTYQIRKSEGRLEKLLCVAVNSRYLPEGITVLPVKVYQPDTRQWHCLPPLLLWGGPGHLMEFKCVAIGPELFVIGGQRAVQFGVKPHAAVWHYKGCQGHWEAIASMHFQSKLCAVAGAVGGKLFVVGMEILQSAIHSMGFDATWSTVTEVLDTTDGTREWMRVSTPAPPISLQYWMAGAVVHNRLFHVVSRKAEGGYLASTLDTQEGGWRMEFDFVPENMHVAGIAPFGAVNGLLYCIFWRGGEGSSSGAMLCWRTETRPWVEVGEVDLMTHGKRKSFALSRSEGFKVEVMENRMLIMEFGYTDDDNSRERGRGQGAGRKFNVLHILRVDGGGEGGGKREYCWEAQDIEMENGTRPQERILGLCSIQV